MKRIFAVIAVFVMFNACAPSGNRAALLTEGAIAPDFTLPDHDGRMIALSEVLAVSRGAVIAFYPKDDSRN